MGMLVPDRSSDWILSWEGPEEAGTRRIPSSRASAHSFSLDSGSPGDAIVGRLFSTVKVVKRSN